MVSKIASALGYTKGIQAQLRPQASREGHQGPDRPPDGARDDHARIGLAVGTAVALPLAYLAVRSRRS